MSGWIQSSSPPCILNESKGVWLAFVMPPTCSFVPSGFGGSSGGLTVVRCPAMSFLFLSKSDLDYPQHFRHFNTQLIDYLYNKQLVIDSSSLQCFYFSNTIAKVSLPITPESIRRFPSICTLPINGGISFRG
jgi:hypothetical protein